MGKTGKAMKKGKLHKKEFNKMSYPGYHLEKAIRIIWIS